MNINVLTPINSKLNDIHPVVPSCQIVDFNTTVTDTSETKIVRAYTKNNEIKCKSINEFRFLDHETIVLKEINEKKLKCQRNYVRYS